MFQMLHAIWPRGTEICEHGKWRHGKHELPKSYHKTLNFMKIMKTACTKHMMSVMIPITIQLFNEMTIGRQSKLDRY